MPFECHRAVLFGTGLTRALSRLRRKTGKRLNIGDMEAILETRFMMPNFASMALFGRTGRRILAVSNARLSWYPLTSSFVTPSLVMQGEEVTKSRHRRFAMQLFNIKTEEKSSFWMQGCHVITLTSSFVTLPLATQEEPVTKSRHWSSLCKFQSKDRSLQAYKEGLSISLRSCQYFKQKIWTGSQVYDILVDSIIFSDSGGEKYCLRL